MKHHPYNDVVEKKLEQLPTVDADQLWTGMHAILDEKMPQKKERRRFIAWFFTANGLLLLTIVSLTVGGSLFLLTKKQNADVANFTLPTNNSTPSTKTTKSEGKKELVSLEKQDKTIVTIEPAQKGNEGTVAASLTPTNTSNVIKNNNQSQQTERYSATDAVENAYDQPMLTYIARKDGKVQTISVHSNAVSTGSGTKINLNLTDDNFKSFQHNSFVAANSNEQASKTNTRPNKEKGLYAGIVSGVDLSSIHFQSTKSGMTKGLILGYAFNNKWSVETGLLWDNKKFYDDGTYFSPAGYTPTPGVTIVAVNGKSRLHELPLNLKYNIIPKKHTLFATAGLSSYFMRSENYDYEYVQNNQPGGHNYLSYKNETKNWFSVANVSVGYSHKLGSIGTIRIEPYLKVPIKHLGVGNMPITSTGLNIGFTKQLTR